MAISTSSSSLHFISLSSKTLSFSKPTSLISLSLSPSSQKSLFPKLLSIPNCNKASAKPISSRLFRNVSAISSGFDLDDDDVSNDSDEFGEENFPPEQKFFVGNLPFSADSGTLAGLFGQAGTVELAEVIYDKVTGRSRGFGFVTMSSIEEVEAAVQQFNGYELDGRALRVNSGPPPRKEESPFRSGPRDGGRGGGRSFDNTNRVYVGNLAWSVDNLALETLFREQGNVLDAKVVYDRDSGRSRGFGFVTYSTADEVNGAIESLNGVDLDGRQIRVSAAEAPPPRRF